MTRPRQPSPPRRALGLTAWVLLALSLPSRAEIATEIRLYQGKLGNQAIVAKLETSKKSGALEGGVYFYRQFGRDMVLMTGQDGRIQECPSNRPYSDEGCETPSGYWEVKPGQTGEKGDKGLRESALSGPNTQLNGLWRSRDGKKQTAITLEALTLAPNTDPDKALEAQRLKDNKLTTGGRKSANGLSWEVRKETRSGQSMPFLVDGVAEDIRQKVNSQLQAEFDGTVTEALSAVEYDSTRQVLFANARWFVVGGGTNAYYAGAAHPLFGFGVTTYDLSTGAPADLLKRFRLTDKKAKFIDLKASDRLDALVLKAFVREAAKADKDEMDCLAQVVDYFQCDERRCTQADPLASASLYPTAKGLAVTLDIYSEAARGCRGEGIVLPWPTARKALLQTMDLP